MSAMKPLCKFCHGHHYEDEEHPEEAVRAALAELRRTEPAESSFAVGRRTIAEVREHVERVTEKAVVTESPLPEVPVLPKRGRPKKAGSLSRAAIQRAYRERKP